MIMGVPYDTEVEYIQANGIAYIDTGVPFTTNYTARCRFQFVSSSSENLAPFGFWYKTQYASRMYWRAGTSDWRYQYPTTDAAVFSSGSTIPFGDIHELEISPSRVTMDSMQVSVTPSSFINANYTQSLFGSSTYNPEAYGSASAYRHEQQSESSIIRIYSASWADETGTIIRDFIPVRVGTTGYMYDRVSKKLFGNQGTGSFVLGPDVAKPIMGIWRYHDIYSASGYIRDGLVAMWDGIENAGWGKHDPNATVWKELISGVNNFTDIGQGKWDNNSVSVVPRIQTVSRFGAEVKTIEMVLDIGAYAPVTNKTCINLPVDTGNATQLKFWGYPSGGANTILIGGFQSLPVCGDYFPRHISMSFDSNAILTDIYFDGQAPQRGISDYHYATYSQIRIGTPNAAGRAYNIRGYNRVLSYNERQYNLHIDKVRFNLP